jgi:hypothetical protein
MDWKIELVAIPVTDVDRAAPAQEVSPGETPDSERTTLA